MTEGVHESVLTADALWAAVTGKPGTGWTETVQVTDRRPGSSGSTPSRDRAGTLSAIPQTAPVKPPGPSFQAQHVRVRNPQSTVLLGSFRRDSVG